jgi:type IV pilus assembly protein PilO
MTNRRAPLIAGIILVVLAVAAFFLLVRPKIGEVGEAEEDLEQAEQEELTLRTELERLQALRDEAPEIQRQLARFRRQIPPVADLPGLINELQDIADVSGVDFFAISPGTPAAAPGGGAAEIPATIQVVGTFFPVDEFLFRLETLPRAAKAVSVTVAEGPEGLPQIDVTMDVRFYTTDTEAGPGAAPEEPAPEASPSPSPTTSPSPTESPEA